MFTWCAAFAVVTSSTPQPWPSAFILVICIDSASQNVNQLNIVVVFSLPILYSGARGETSRVSLVPGVSESQQTFLSVTVSCCWCWKCCWLECELVIGTRRRDHTLQSIVYKMAPNLARNELKRRQEFRRRKGHRGLIPADIFDEEFLWKFDVFFFCNRCRCSQFDRRPVPAVVFRRFRCHFVVSGVRSSVSHLHIWVSVTWFVTFCVQKLRFRQQLVVAQSVEESEGGCVEWRGEFWNIFFSTIWTRVDVSRDLF